MANKKGYVLVEDDVTVPITTGWRSYTPIVTLVGGAGNTVPVYTTNSGRYQRICNTILVDILLQGDGGAEGAGTGVFNISLPINGGTSTNSDGVGNTGFVVNGADQDSTTRKINLHFWYEVDV